MLKGVIEIRWRDDRGNHFEQGNMEFWIRMPWHTALRVTKVGDTYLWLGSDEEHYWLFDLFSDVETLHVGRHDQPKLGAESGRSAFDVQPPALLDLLGLTPIESPMNAEGDAAYDAEHKAWVVESPGKGGLMRIYFDVQTKLPKRIESLSAKDEVKLHSTLSRYASVTMQDMAPIAFPKIAEWVNIVSVPEDDSDAAQPQGDVTIAINEAEGYADPEQLGRVFDLQRLIKSLEPARIEGELPAQRASATPAR